MESVVLWQVTTAVLSFSVQDSPHHDESMIHKHERVIANAQNDDAGGPFREGCPLHNGSKQRE